MFMQAYTNQTYALMRILPGYCFSGTARRNSLPFPCPCSMTRRRLWCISPVRLN